MTTKDTIIGIIAAIFLVKFLIYVFKSKPADKYHNDSWKKK